MAARKRKLYVSLRTVARVLTAGFMCSEREAAESCPTCAEAWRKLRQAAVSR